MKLVPDWKRVITVTISWWCLSISALLIIIPEARYWLTGADYNPYLTTTLSLAFLLTGMVGRLFQQGDNPVVELIRIVVLTVTITLACVVWVSYAYAAAPSEDDIIEEAVPFIASWEGKRNAAYKDIVGVWTICYGSTRGVLPGMVLSDLECLELLDEEVREYKRGLYTYFTETTRQTRLSVERAVAYISLAFNAGIRAVGRSTATKRLNAGDIAGGCQALTWWNKAGGRVIRGLVRRRSEEYALCMQGL